jgi:hypothetical protein
MHEAKSPQRKLGKICQGEAGIAGRTSSTMSLQSGERLNGFWYEEVVTEDLYLKMELKKITFNGESKFQVPGCSTMLIATLS